MTNTQSYLCCSCPDIANVSQISAICHILQFYNCMCVFVALKDPRKMNEPSLFLWSNSFLSWWGFILYKVNGGTFVISFYVGTKGPHTAPYTESKEGECTVSFEQRWQLSVFHSLKAKLRSQSPLWREPLWLGLRFKKTDWQLHLWCARNRTAGSQGAGIASLCAYMCR